MIPVVEPDGHFGQLVGFVVEVVHVFRQQLNQSLVIQQIGFWAVGEEGEAQASHSQMPLDAMRRFVETNPFRCHTGVTSLNARD